MPKPKLIQHAEHEGMWHVMYPDGHLSDMLNLTRAKDLVNKLVEDYERNRKPGTC